MNLSLPTQSVRRQAVLAVFAVVLLIVGAGLVGWLGGGALATSAAEVPARRVEPNAEPADEELVADRNAPAKAAPVSIGDSLSQAGMADIESDDPMGDLDVASAAIDDGSKTAEQQCRDIEAEVSLRWDDGRMTDDDYESRWENFLSEDEYATILVPSLEANGSILLETDRMTFIGFENLLVLDDLDNDQLISGYDNCYEIDLYDFE